jgi:phosphoribosylamine-glycine ligase
MRDGWPAKHNQVALHQGDHAKFMQDLVEGRDTLKANDGEVSISVVVSIPPYPYSDYSDKETEGKPLYGVDLAHHHLCEVQLEDDVPVQAGEKVVHMPCYTTAGDYVAVVTGTGDTINGASRSAYAAVRKLEIAGGKMFRNDIGELGEKLTNVQKHGYATGLS